MKKTQPPSSMSPTIELLVGSGGVGAAAGRTTSQPISPEQLNVIQVAVGQVITGFQPPQPPEAKDGSLEIGEIELEIGFKLEAGVAQIWKLILVDGKAEATIKAKITWSRPG